MILSISLKRLCSGFGRTDIGYVNNKIIEHFITVTFPYNAKFLLTQERTILFIFSFVSSKLYLIRRSVFPFVGIVIQNNGHVGEKLCVQISIFDFPSGANSDLL